VVQEAEYDGLGRRIRKVVTNAGDLDGTVVYYYNGQQMIETRDGSGNVLMQVVHGTRYIDEVVQLFLQNAGRVYVHQDANYNVTTLTDITGRVLERSFYSPYGQLEAVISSYPFDYDDDGDVDDDDADAVIVCYSGDGYSGDCRRLDADGNREVDYDDFDIVDAYVSDLSGDTDLTRVPGSPRSRLDNPFAHQGLALDAEIASYQNRARQYNPTLKRFMQRDPLTMRNRAGSGYQDGMNLHTYVDSSPTRRRDPAGLATPCCDAIADAIHLGERTRHYCGLDARYWIQYQRCCTDNGMGGGSLSTPSWRKCSCHSNCDSLFEIYTSAHESCEAFDNAFWGNGVPEVVQKCGAELTGSLEAIIVALEGMLGMCD
jgi:RHS repeat-associated protein